MHIASSDMLTYASSSSSFQPMHISSSYMLTYAPCSSCSPRAASTSPRVASTSPRMHIHRVHMHRHATIVKGCTYTGSSTMILLRATCTGMHI